MLSWRWCSLSRSSSKTPVLRDKLSIPAYGSPEVAGSVFEYQQRIWKVYFPDVSTTSIVVGSGSYFSPTGDAISLPWSRDCVGRCSRQPDDCAYNGDREDSSDVYIATHCLLERLRIVRFGVRVCSCRHKYNACNPSLHGARKI